MDIKGRNMRRWWRIYRGNQWRDKEFSKRENLIAAHLVRRGVCVAGIRGLIGWNENCLLVHPATDDNFDHAFFADHGHKTGRKECFEDERGKQEQHHHR